MYTINHQFNLQLIFYQLCSDFCGGSSLPGHLMTILQWLPLEESSMDQQFIGYPCGLGTTSVERLRLWVFSDFTFPFFKRRACNTSFGTPPPRLISIFADWNLPFLFRSSNTGNAGTYGAVRQIWLTCPQGAGWVLVRSRGILQAMSI